MTQSILQIFIITAIAMGTCEYLNVRHYINMQRALEEEFGNEMKPYENTNLY